MSHYDKDITISALTVDQILALDENQLSLPLDYPAGNIDFTFDPNMSTAASDFTISGLDVVDLSGNIDWSSLGSNVTLGPVWSDTLSAKPSSKITLNGDDADIEINGVGLSKRLDAIEQRLNILTPNPELEGEWDQLRRLGERYRKMEQKLLEKSKVWDAIKS